MATILLQVAGGFLGGFLGPVGAAIGTAAGALGGYMIDRAWMTGGQTQEGPRLDGARPFTAEEGSSLPRVYGAARIGGTLIWATRFEEVRTTKRQGFKGGPKTAEYSYFANVAFALCEGEIAGVRRIWADGQEVDREKIELRVYKGTQDQAVDPLIAVKQGDGNAPAYRGTAYVVIERLPLDTYGNRVPQFQFEVLRPLTGPEAGIEQDIQAVCLIPGSTEYGLATTQVDKELREGEAEAANRHVLHAASDLDAALDELEMLCPRLKNVALVVTWFGDDLRAGMCRIRPAVADGEGSYSKAWSVAGVTRDSATVVSMAGGGSAYGGTPSDASVKEAIAAIKARGWGVTIYPFIMMDVAAGNALPDPHGGAAQAAYPWRGRISCYPGPRQPGSADKTAAARTQVNAFCGGDWGYRRLVLHYAQLAAEAGGVDAFLLGSELRGLTTLRGGAGAFPFVEQLCTLASDVRAIVGPGTKITYGADWSEYFGHHPADGSGDVLFHLDPLWAHAEIDAIGIDNYMPLSDWRDGDVAGGNPDEFASAYELDGLRGQVAGGEGFDWYYANDADRRLRIRTPITDGGYGKPWVFRYKDLVSWWSNPHHNRIGGVEQVSPTVWTPRSKPIWFAEIGCAAVDKGPNQPNLFIDPKSAESGLPYFSTGQRSDIAQRRYLRASLDHWDDAAGNPVSPVYGDRMIDVEQTHVWAWDARPFPAFPLRSDAWSDGANWHLGHWLNGRLGGVELGALVNAVLADHGLPAADVSGVAGTVHGYLVADPTTARAALEPVVELFGLDVRERADGLVVSDGDNAVAVTELDELAVEDGAAIIETARTPAHDIPAQAILAFRDPLRDYQAATAYQSRPGASGSGQESFNFQGTLEPGLADGLLERRLADLWLDRERRVFAVPAGAPGTEPGDRVDAEQLGGPHLVLEAEEGIVRRITARPVRQALPLNWAASLPTAAKPALVAGRPWVQLLDLPMTPSSTLPHRQFRLAAWQRPWRSQSVYASPEDTGYELRASVPQATNAGQLAEALAPGFEGRIDRAGALVVDLFDGEAASVSRAQMLNGANALAVKAANGVWEIVQFQAAEEIAAGRWRMTGLLRGQLGTSDAMAAGAAAGSPVVMLDDAVSPAGLKPGETGLTLNWRIGPSGEAFGDAHMVTVAAAGGARALTPLSPGHLRCAVAGADRRFSWIRRSRIDADSWDGADVPLGEEAELYRIEIAGAGGPVVRSATVSAPLWTYAATDFAADFPVPPGAFDVTVRQIGTGGRLGLPARMNLSVS